MGDGRDDKGRWQVGHSGNPAGRPVGSVSLSAIIRQRLAGTRLAGQDTPDGRAVAEWFVDMMIKMAMEGQAAYMREVLDRNDGPVPRSAEPEALTVADAIKVVDFIDQNLAERQGSNGQPERTEVPGDPGPPGP